MYEAYFFAGVPNLSFAKRVWPKLGGQVVYPPQTGEVLFTHPLVGRVRVNNRRKDCPRELVSKLRQLIKLLGGDPNGRRAA